MEKIFEFLMDSENKHIDKITQHTQVEADLKLQYENTDRSDENFDKIEKQLMNTIKQIEYHKGAIRAYKKSTRKLSEMLEIGEVL